MANDVVPKHEFKRDGEVWQFYSKEVTGLDIIKLTDTLTGISLSAPLVNSKLRGASHLAWAGARHSRSAGGTENILAEMMEKNVNPDSKLEETFRGYGHASVADMARISLHFNDVPMHVPLWIFNYGDINSGQEKSTRFQKQFKGAALHPLSNYLPLNANEPGANDGYHALAELARSAFSDFQPKVTEAFKKYYQPESQSDTRALEARVLDTIRYFLLLGQATGFAFETSARDWSRLISRLKAAPVPVYKGLGLMLERFLAPDAEIEKEMSFLAEAPSLIRHTSEDSQLIDNLRHLEAYLINASDMHEKIKEAKYRDECVEVLPANISIGSRAIMQYILCIWPELDDKGLLDWIDGLPNEKRSEIGRIIFRGHDHHHEMPSCLTRVTGLTAVVRGTLGELRDFNRHRGFGRFVQAPNPLMRRINKNSALSLIGAGYGVPLYLSKISEFKELLSVYKERMDFYYMELGGFVEIISQKCDPETDYSFILNLLPLAHRVNLWMHGDPKQFQYCSALRTRPGGHINYRVLAHDLNTEISKHDPFLSGGKLQETRPDPSDRKQFFSRA